VVVPVALSALGDLAAEARLPWAAGAIAAAVLHGFYWQQARLTGAGMSVYQPANALVAAAMAALLLVSARVVRARRTRTRAGRRQARLIALRLAEAGHRLLLSAGQKAQDLYGGERRVGSQGGIHALERPVHLQIDAIGTQARLRLDVEKGIEPLRVGELDAA